MPVEDVDEGAWNDLRDRLAAGPGDAEAAAYLAFSRARSPASYARQRPIELFQSTGFAFDTSRARRALAGSGLACPPAGAALLRRYVRDALRGRSP